MDMLKKKKKNEQKKKKKEKRRRSTNRPNLFENQRRHADVILQTAAACF
jgi:hypothetical protein